MLTTPKKLRKLGILGMNRRNVEMIAAKNPRRLYPLVDDKLKTKKVAQSAGIAVPTLLGVVSQERAVKNLPQTLEAHRQFVIKPANGSGGKGILVVTHHDGDSYVKASGDSISMEAIQRHVSNTLSGMYSLAGRADVAMIEALVEFDPIFDDYSYEGVPDIRLIVYMGFPVMAMVRLATHESDGKANLHQGAVGVGIDIASGQPLRAVQHGRPVTHHPDTKHRLSDVKIPHWQRMLKLGAACYDVTGMGYLGVDIVLDQKLGPLIIELNARPGLAIQVANGCGLIPRFERIDGLTDAIDDPEERAQWSRQAFGAPASVSSIE